MTNNHIGSGFSHSLGLGSCEKETRNPNYKLAPFQLEINLPFLSFMTPAGRKGGHPPRMTVANCGYYTNTTGQEESDTGQSDIEQDTTPLLLVECSALNRQQEPLEIADGAGRMHCESLSSSAGVFCCEPRYIR